MEPTTKTNTKKTLRFFGLTLVFIILSVASIAIYNGLFGSSVYNSSSYNPDCNIATVYIRGNILTYIPPESYGSPDTYGNPTLLEDDTASEAIVEQIEMANDDPNVDGVLVEIDSYGGYPVAGEEIATALKAITKPTVAVIRGAGASAAYWAATGADRIIASANSDIGGIGVTMSYLENTDPNSKYIQLSSGKFKDAGNPDKPLTAEERELLLRDITIVHQNFIKAVSENRNLPYERVAKLADGSTVLGAKAKELGLIDEIGSWQEAKNYLAETTNTTPQMCW